MEYILEYVVWDSSAISARYSILFDFFDYLKEDKTDYSKLNKTFKKL